MLSLLLELESFFKVHGKHSAKCYQLYRAHNVTFVCTYCSNCIEIVPKVKLACITCKLLSMSQIFNIVLTTIQKHSLHSQHFHCFEELVIGYASVMLIYSLVIIYVFTDMWVSHIWQVISLEYFQVKVHQP